MAVIKWRTSIGGVILILAGVFLLSGCQGGVDNPRAYSFRLNAAQDVNPDITGRPSPVRIWLLTLSDDEALRHADFFSLVEGASQSPALGVLARRSLMLRPGESTDITLSPSDEGRYIAVLAEFRDLTEGRWHRLWPISRDRTVPLGVRISRQSVALDDLNE
ncbi:type VI secretion system lipoprotein TssJ [Pantoea sp. LS15]|uniref:type VI secretion system lipoprotein TssJ n=1 Tax=Enterobacterales TaxID=91347 RepID=UPI000E0F789F|nr:MULTISPECIES: type VI secretion system lipoprotein TssJ [Enterobacterales]NJQ21803.1 type VI secretion system lipoprotein TssJ [Pantoea sp. LS15]NKF48399.1 type VI secretion system lipoprotein TssJ [Pantoea sp. LS15]RDK12957.1 type VI secretion system lipoprotein TssJ [Enterobacter sp. 9-2]